jgi:hypothetical protein
MLGRQQLAVGAIECEDQVPPARKKRMVRDEDNARRLAQAHPERKLARDPPDKDRHVERRFFTKGSGEELVSNRKWRLDIIAGAR